MCFGDRQLQHWVLHRTKSVYHVLHNIREKNELWFVFSKKKKTKGIGSYFVFIFAFTAWKMGKDSAVLRIRMENGACSSEAQICMPGP